MDPNQAAALARFAARFGNVSAELNGGKSMVCSPLSAQAILALTALSSSGDTRAELLEAVAVDDEAIRSFFAFATSSLRSINGLKMANRIFVPDRGTPKPQILKDAELFNIDLEQLDFASNMAAAKINNKWVANKTDYRIKELVPPSGLNSKTSMVLVNDVHFHGIWEQPFMKSGNIDRTFHVNSITNIEVPMMCRTDVRCRYKHSTELKAQFLQLYFKGQQASMVVILPDEVEGLNTVLQQLAAGHDLPDELASLQTALVDVVMPGFKVQNRVDMRQLWFNMGIRSLLDEETSNIQMLSTNEPLFVSHAIQRAMIVVDEGNDAVGTTIKSDPQISRRSIPDKHIFVANRPFLYLLTVGQIPFFLGIYEGKDFMQDTRIQIPVGTGVVGASRKRDSRRRLKIALFLLVTIIILLGGTLTVRARRKW